MMIGVCIVAHFESSLSIDAIIKPLTEDEGKSEVEVLDPFEERLVVLLEPLVRRVQGVVRLLTDGRELKRDFRTFRRTNS